jgi:SAM-dependent methyltransferase
MAQTGTLYKGTFFRHPAQRSAEAIVPVVIDLVQPRSVVDIGCGTGTWLAAFHRHGVADVFGLDGDWVPRDRLEIPRDQFQSHDLSQPLDLGRRFDLAVCLEVAEHLPAVAADSLVGLLTRHASVVLFSAAIPGQGGTGHVNEQWPGYWLDRFVQRDYLVVDCLRRRFWNDDRVEGCYAQNMRLLVSPTAMASSEALRREQQVQVAFPMDAVHPRVFDAARSQNVGLRTLLHMVPSAARRAVHRRLAARGAA